MLHVRRAQPGQKTPAATPTCTLSIQLAPSGGLKRPTAAAATDTGLGLLRAGATHGAEGMLTIASW